MLLDVTTWVQINTNTNSIPKVLRSTVMRSNAGMDKQTEFA